MKGIISLITPLLLHMAVSELAVLLLGDMLDAASCTSIASLAVIFPVGWIYLREKRMQDTAKEFTGEERTGKTYGEYEDIIQRNQQMKQNRQVIRKNSWYRISVSAVICFLGGGVLNYVWSSILVLLQITQVFSNQIQEQLLAGQFVIQMIGLGMLVPLAEELIFRGLIYTRMKQFFPVKFAVLCSALLFAVYHGNPIQIIFAVPMALVLTVIYERGGSLIYPVLFHAGSNLAAVMMNL